MVSFLWQIVKPVKFRFPEWEKQRGLYRSEIRINFHGETTIADLRKNKFIYAYDNNMFATGYVHLRLFIHNFH